VTMWIDTGADRLPAGVREQLTEQQIRREDRDDRVWINLESGAMVVLISEGGSRTAGQSAFKVFHRTPGADGPLNEITFGMLGDSSEPYEEADTAGDTYRFLYRRIVEKITARLIPASPPAAS
jgi:hypothetical protein